ncbi:APC family permease [Spiroplasma culicicola]|uniref:Amino acid permease n=1 Tax=Spiroplasma culicicola AES-1 TaxID=1276246 RepID=W6A8U6_9MOLU|nr:amino acid permease [Spiroplasma culicicola]AHI53386.1 amino acid permease [Spiroplasma culicicola AES-1]
MIKVNKKNKARNKIFEFLTIFSMAFGIVVGSGIYLKNRSSGGVLETAGQNPYLALVVWAFIGVVCTLMMISFIEIASSIEKDDHNTVQSWSNKFLNRQSASLFSIFYVGFYMPVLASIGALFTVDVLFTYGIEPFLAATGKTALHETLSTASFLSIKITLSTILLISFQIMNSYTSKPSKWIQTIFTFVKFIPLFAVVIGGFVLFLTGNVDGESNSFDKSSGQWSLGTFFATAIPILFAFDGFIHASTLQKDVEHKEVVEPAMLTAIIGVTAFYIIITISIFIGANDGNIFNLFDSMFNENAPGISLLFKIIITLTILTVINGYTTLIPRTIKSAADEKFIYLGKRYENISHKSASFLGAIITDVIYIFTTSISIIIGIVRNETPNHMLIADTLSSTTVIYCFLIYLALIIGQIRNRHTNKVNVRKVKGAYVIGIITAILLIIVLGYVNFEFFIMPFIRLDFIGLLTSISSLIVIVPIAIWYFINEELIKKSTFNPNIK